MKYSGKMCFKIVTKSQGSTLSIEDTFFKKPQEGGSSLKFEKRYTLRLLSMCLEGGVLEIVLPRRGANDLPWGKVCLEDQR